MNAADGLSHLERSCAPFWTHRASGPSHAGWSCRHNPVQCVLPPTVLRGLLIHGNARQRDAAARALLLDSTFRTGRAARAEALYARRQVRRLWRQALPWRQWLASLAQGPVLNVFSAEQTQRLPGRLVRRNGAGATGDLAVDEAYDGLGATYDLFYEEFDRRSIDDENMPLNATVHFGQDYDNAFWDGTLMVFGDGDVDVFNRFTAAVDVTAHELTHGVTEHEAGLIYWGQAGALNESISDVFGSLVKQYQLGQTAATADWLIGEGLLTAAVNGDALRSMSDPGSAYDDPLLGGKDPQPGHWDGYVHTLEDNGGVHINSGIPNRAFYLVASYIGGNAWEAPGQIWYETLRSPMLRRWTQFYGFARLTYLTARTLFPGRSLEAEAVRDAWADVGIPI
jgi:Zn-dependent metalloprotease